MTEQRIPWTPERFVGVGFRGWLAGYEYGDVACWEYVWNAYASELGATRAKRAVAELSSGVRTVRQSSCRRIQTYPTECSGFCKDECIAISIIAACQHDNCPAVRACAFALLGSSDIDLLTEATAFANVLLKTDLRLSQSVICNVAMIGDAPNSHRRH